MVKKIRRRVEKEDTDNPIEVVETPEEIDGSEEGFVADIEQFAEDSFTRGIVDLLKLAYAQRKVIVGAIAITVVGFAYSELSEATEQEGLSTRALAVSEGLAALEKATGDSDTTASENEDKALSDEDRSASLNKASRVFGSLSGAAVLAEGGKAAASFALGDFKSSANGYAAAATSSDDNLVRAVALSGKAAALEDAGDREGAQQAWAELAKLNKDLYEAAAAVQQARLFLADNKTAEARGVISKVDTVALSPFGLKPKVEQIKGLLPEAKK